MGRLSMSCLLLSRRIVSHNASLVFHNEDELGEVAVMAEVKDRDELGKVAMSEGLLKTAAAGEFGEELIIISEINNKVDLGFGGQNLMNFEDIGVVVKVAYGVDLANDVGLHCGVNRLVLVDGVCRYSGAVNEGVHLVHLREVAPHQEACELVLSEDGIGSSRRWLFRSYCNRLTQAAVEAGHVYSLVGVARAKYKLGHMAVSLVEENKIGAVISEIDKIIGFKVSLCCLKLRAWFNIHSKELGSRVILKMFLLVEIEFGLVPLLEFGEERGFLRILNTI
ncbi:hypothetical protein VNO78_07813 [Psophocarpus tetragonolobus]|uniref:Uncharacterized protein n=1 Tax=Psophocarpus tetragonolobus TaxID=3891 RepID=A0AAN9XSE6_PSOTE